MAGIYSTLDQYIMLGRITRLPRWSRRDVLAGARLDRVDGDIWEFAPEDILG